MSKRGESSFSVRTSHRTQWDAPSSSSTCCGFPGCHACGFSDRPAMAPLAARSDLSIVELPRNPYAAAKVVRRRWPEAIIVASKPILTSYGVALASRRRPIVLDIDDPEVALATADARTVASTLFKATNPLATACLTVGRFAANAITVANGVLQARYGGSVIPHARDETIFDANLRDRAASRHALGLSDDDCIVAYVGTFRAHKGVQDLRLAAKRLPPRVKLALVGGTLVEGSDNEILAPPGPYLSTMRWVSAADIVVVPQRRSRVGLRAVTRPSLSMRWPWVVRSWRPSWHPSKRSSATLRSWSSPIRSKIWSEA